MHQDIPAQRIQLGYEILGPIFFDFCHRLHTHFLAFDDRSTVFLFCTRAGLRLQYLYELFLASQGFDPPANPHRLFWTSRFMTAKGLFVRNPQATFQILAKEFGYTTVTTLLPCLLPADELGGLDLSFTSAFKSHLGSQPSPQLLEAIFSHDSGFADRLRQHYNQQSTLFKQQIEALVQQAPVAVLVDSGWQGTTQRLLMEGFPEIDWQGLYFGRMGAPDQNWHFFNAIGLMFESAAYHPKQPATCIHYHHHIIEDLLEPELPSVEYLVADAASGAVLPPEPCRRFDYRPPAANEHHYAGVLQYFQSITRRQTLLDIRSNSREAWQILDRKIRFPAPSDVDLLDVRPRSPDFGKRESNTVVCRSTSWLANRTPDDRLLHAIWKQGQIALDHPTDYHQRQALFAKPEPDIQPETEPLTILSDLPQVAIITRTKNRPVLLKRAAQSVAAQTLRDFVWVVVNDGGDGEEVEQIIRQSPVDLRQVRVVHHPDSIGMEAASNRGIQTSQSKYLVIHDDDDTWQPEFLQRTVAFLENPPVPSMRGVITHATRWSEAILGDQVELLESTPYQDWVMTVPLYEMASGNMFAPISFLFDRAVYEEIGGFDESLPVLGDWDFNLRFLMKYDIGVIPEKLANYHHRDYQKTGDYSNSVYGAISKHQLFDTVVRNRGLRQLNAEELPLSSILSLARASGDIRAMVQEILRQRG